MKLRKSKSEVELIIHTLLGKGYKQTLFERDGNQEKLVLLKEANGRRRRIQITMSSNGWVEVT